MILRVGAIFIRKIPPYQHMFPSRNRITTKKENSMLDNLYLRLYDCWRILLQLDIWRRHWSTLANWWVCWCTGINSSRSSPFRIDWKPTITWCNETNSVCIYATLAYTHTAHSETRQLEPVHLRSHTYNNMNTVNFLVNGFRSSPFSVSYCKQFVIIFPIVIFHYVFLVWLSSFFYAYTHTHINCVVCFCGSFSLVYSVNVFSCIFFSHPCIIC